MIEIKFKRKLIIQRKLKNLFNNVGRRKYSFGRNNIQIACKKRKSIQQVALINKGSFGNDFNEIFSGKSPCFVRSNNCSKDFVTFVFL